MYTMVFKTFMFLIFHSHVFAFVYIVSNNAMFWSMKCYIFVDKLSTGNAVLYKLILFFFNLMRFIYRLNYHNFQTALNITFKRIFIAFAFKQNVSPVYLDPGSKLKADLEHLKQNQLIVESDSEDNCRHKQRKVCTIL